MMEPTLLDKKYLDNIQKQCEEFPILYYLIDFKKMEFREVIEDLEKFLKVLPELRIQNEIWLKELDEILEKRNHGKL